MSVLYQSLALLLILFCSDSTSSKISVHLDFEVPGSDELISTKLLTQSPQDVTFYKTIRAVLHIHSIAMECTFSFDTSAINHNRVLVCDAYNACITSSSLHLEDPSSATLHLENIGTGNLDIVQIKKSDQILFYDNMVCIGDSQSCDTRYIDFNLNSVTESAQISTSTKPHPVFQCNPKDTVYPLQIDSDIAHDADGDEEDEQVIEVNHVPPTPSYSTNGSRRKLLRIHDDIYGDFNHKHSVQVVQHGNYMDVILTMIFLILIIVSVFNMSYAFNEIKSASASPRRHYFDTRRV